MKKGRYLLLGSFCIALLDRYITTFLISSCVQNSGIAFGIQFRYQELLFLILAVLLIILSVKVVGVFRYVILSILTLGLANYISRVLYGYVCDYVSLLGISFNIVDVGIVILVTVGILICILNIYGEKGQR